METKETDVVVVGGGPAGSTVSTILAQRGASVRLFEREKFPRFHIGESLIPETYWVLKRLNMLDKMKASPFVKKYSVQFVNAAGQGVGAVLLPRQQAARVLADLAGDPQRVRHDDARQRPRARRRRRSARPRAGGAVRGRPGRRRAGPRRDWPGAHRARQGRRRRQRPEHHAAKPLQAAVVGPGAQQGRDLDLLAGRLSRHRPRRRGDGRDPNDESARLVVVHPAARQHDQRRRRRRRSTICSRAGGATSKSTTRKSPLARPSSSASPEPSARRAISPRRTIRIARSRWPARVGCWSATLSGFSIRSIPPACCSRSSRASWPPTPSPTDWPAATRRLQQLGRWGELFNKGIDRMRRLVCEYYDGFSFGQFIKKYPQSARQDHRPADRRPVRRQGG